jgi:ribulose-bisphosphate carboxylase small chain
MATVFTAPKVVAPAAAGATSAPKAPLGMGSLKPLAAPRDAFRARTVQNGAKVRQMMIWNPYNNKCFETLSYLPPLTPEQISAQVDYMLRNGWIPCLEFAPQDMAYVDSRNTVRFGPVASGYQDNRYWTMWKLPMFGCSSGDEVLREIANVTKTFPDDYIRLVAFDQVRQVQCAGFLVHRPPTSTEYTLPDRRSVT